MSWAGLDREVGSLSRFLVHVPALEPGDRLGVLGRNSAEYLQVITRGWLSQTILWMLWWPPTVVTACKSKNVLH